MPRLGDYQANRIVRRDALTTTYSVRDGEGSVRIRLLSPAVPLDHEEERQLDAAFTADAYLRDDLASQSRHWARVGQVDLAHTDDNRHATRSKPRPFIATHHPALDAEAVRVHGFRHDAITLWRLADGLIGGLEALVKAADRPHGAMSEAAVGVDLSRGRERLRVQLSEPALPTGGSTSSGGTRLSASVNPAEDAARREAGFATDARAVGAILYAAVTGRWPTVTERTRGIEESVEWQPLGRRGRNWRSLVGDLMSSEASDRWRPQSARSRLDALRPTRSRVTPAVRRGAIALLVVGITAGGYAASAGVRGMVTAMLEDEEEQPPTLDGQTFRALIGSPLLAGAWAPPGPARERTRSPSPMSTRRSTTATARPVPLHERPTSPWAGSD